MKKTFFCLILALCSVVAYNQSLIDADSIILINNQDGTYDALAVTVYQGLSAQTIKTIYKDRFEKSKGQKLQSAKTALQYEEKAKRDEAKYTEITGDTIAIDSIDLDGDWSIKGGEVSLKFKINKNKSNNAKVELKIVSDEELIISIDKVGEVSFYKKDENTWIGKADTLYRMTIDKARAKNNKIK